MPESSIVVTLVDRYSDSAKKMTAVTRAFSKDVDELEDQLQKLNKNKYSLKVDAQKAKQALKEAEKQFAATGKEADGLKVELAMANYDNIVKQINLVSKAAQEGEKRLQKMGDAASKEENRAGKGMLDSIKGIFSGDGIGGKLASSGLYKMLGDSLSEAIGIRFESAVGQPIAALGSSLISGAASGIAAGSMFGPTGALIGGGIGALSGAISGASRNYQVRDDAFKSYVQEAYEGQMSAQEASLTSGSALAAQRETDRISFETLFRQGGVEDMGIVETYLSNLVEMANNTPFLYGDLTAMSKTLATYGYSAQADAEKRLSGERDYNYILDVLETVGDAGAALGQSTGDMEAVATAIGQMKSSSKATLEHLNVLNDRGIGAVGMLAEARGVDQRTMYDMISKGQVSGREAAEIILQAMTESFSGSMLAQSRTFSGLTSTVEGLSQELDSAMGQGYNEGRMKGLADQKTWLSGENSRSMQEAYSMIGQWKASLENTKEEMERDALEAVMTGTLSDTFQNSDQGKRLTEMAAEYQAALAEQEKGSTEAGARMGALLAEARVIAMNEYNASEGAQLALESAKSLAEAIRNDTSLNSDYWDAGYEKGQWFTKGLAAAMGEGKYFVKADVDQETGLTVYTDSYGLTADSMLVDPGGAGGLRRSGYAYGLDYVPYDNFPALLHQGERVQTAAEARGERAAPSVTITGNNFTIREEADVTRVASELLVQMELAGMRG